MVGCPISFWTPPAGWQWILKVRSSLDFNVFGEEVCIVILDTTIVFNKVSADFDNVECGMSALIPGPPHWFPNACHCLFNKVFCWNKAWLFGRECVRFYFGHPPFFIGSNRFSWFGLDVSMFILDTPSGFQWISMASNAALLSWCRAVCVPVLILYTYLIFNGSSNSDLVIWDGVTCPFSFWTHPWLSIDFGVL